jgi:hypothetical protein
MERMNRKETLAKLLDDLQSFRAPNAFNPWGESDPLDSPGSGVANSFWSLNAPATKVADSRVSH